MHALIDFANITDQNLLEEGIWKNYVRKLDNNEELLEIKVQTNMAITSQIILFQKELADLLTEID